MKVLYVAHSSGLQGAGIALMNILRGIQQCDIVPILLLPSRGPISEAAKRIGIKCYFSHHRNAIYPQRKSIIDYILYPLRLIRTLSLNYLAEMKLEKIIKTEKPDIIHSNSGVIHFGAEISRKHNIPHVWHIRECQTPGLGYIPIGGNKVFFNKLNYGNNHCIAITQAVFRYHELKSEKDSVIYDGVYDESLFSTVIDFEKSNYFLFVGNLIESKGIYDAIDAFCEFAKEYPDIEFWLAGKTNNEVINYIAQSIYKDRIKLLGFRRDVYDLMRKAKALLVPSYYEGFGFITAEAMANGCLVIGRNAAGTKEQFDNGLNITGKEVGFRFNNQEDLTNLMSYVVSMSKTELKQYIESARLASREYTIDKNVINVVNYYKRILNKS